MKLIILNTEGSFVAPLALSLHGLGLCHGLGLTPGPATSTWHGHGQKKKKC